MQLSPHRILFLILAVCFSPAARSHAQGDLHSKARRQDHQRILAALKEGAGTNDVINAIGIPDEIRFLPFPADQFHKLDGARYFSKEGPETERWAYGVLGKGMFASQGFVSFDRRGRVVNSQPTDSFAWVTPPRPTLVPADSDRARASPSGMICQVRSVVLVPARELSDLPGEADILEMHVTVTNSGTAQFDLKHDAARTMDRFFVMELYESTGGMIRRDNNLLHHSPMSPDPAEWPTLSIPAGSQKSCDLALFLDGFGPLPAGKYSVRVYFPFEKERYYPSNLLPFTLKK